MERRGGLLGIQGDVLLIDGGIWVSYMVVLGVRVRVSLGVTYAWAGIRYYA